MYYYVSYCEENCLYITLMEDKSHMKLYENEKVLIALQKLTDEIIIENMKINVFNVYEAIKCKKIIAYINTDLKNIRFKNCIYDDKPIINSVIDDIR